MTAPNLQLRKAGIDKIILAGMSANLCVHPPRLGRD
jgi:nicotinamidase-related amidase